MEKELRMQWKQRKISSKEGVSVCKKKKEKRMSYTILERKRTGRYRIQKKGGDV